MNTPICDFVRSYAESDSLRLHMPGHKGVGFLGYEAFDITEIQGADSLYETDGIIAKSELKNKIAITPFNNIPSKKQHTASFRVKQYIR